MSHQVLMAAEAEADLWDIYRFIQTNDGHRRAEFVLEKISEACRRLNTHPRSGHVPPELERIGVLEYLEVHFKPYRIIYHIEGRKVFIHCILDGRRDMQELLARRLVR